MGPGAFHFVLPLLPLVPRIWSSLGTRDSWGIPGGLDGGAGLLLGLWLGCRVGPSSFADVTYLDSSF